MARRSRMGQRQPDVHRHKPGLRAGAEQGQRQNSRGNGRRTVGAADRLERVAAVGTRQETKTKQQRKRPETRHQQVDVSGARVAALPVVRHHERPRGERHELPGEQERERVVGQHDQIHAGEKCGEEGQHATRLAFVPSVAEAVEACRGAAQIDDREKRCRQRVEPEMCAQPRQSDGQVQRLRQSRVGHAEPIRPLPRPASRRPARPRTPSMVVVACRAPATATMAVPRSAAMHHNRYFHRHGALPRFPLRARWGERYAGPDAISAPSVEPLVHPSR